MSEIDWELLFRYLGGECDAQERQRVEAWYADPHHRATLEAAATAAGRILQRTPEPARLRIAAAVEPRRSSPRWMRVLAAAACLVAATGLAVRWTVERQTGRFGDASVAVNVATTGPGQRATLRLADGTRVVLGVASTLRYPAAFGAGSRNVSLTGEGYFEVAHDTRRPFRVHANGATIEDIGTSFGIHAYDADSVIGVVVAEGIVALTTGTGGHPNGTRLHAGQRARLTRGASQPAVDDVDVATSLAWIDGRLAFDDAPLPQALVELERWYDVKLRIGDRSLASRRLTGSFGSGSRAEVLSAIAAALDVRYIHAADTLVLVRAARAH